MRLFVMNPNTSVAMTGQIRRALEKVKRADTEIAVVNPGQGPVSIEGAHDETLAGPGILALIAKAKAEEFDAILLACLSDPALDAAASSDERNARGSLST